MTIEINSASETLLNPHQPSKELVSELAELIIESVNLHHLNPHELNADTIITQGGMNLDSVDILEVVVAIEQKYKVKIKTAEEGQAIFRTLGTLAAFISQKKIN